MIKHAMELIDPASYLLAAGHEEFHEGIVGIVAGRITEKFNKPSLIMGIDKEKGIATGSLR
ncbi:MAG: hypothetical protein H6765_02390 [Candidatus Peribacteria bacterium]|nr:MAG: hypothetical protein H6765_02390 [Candidatus Peribacteria bacterium]